MSKKQNVVTHVKDEFKLQYTRTTTTTFTDSNKRYSIQNKQVSTATHQRSYNDSTPLYLTGGLSNRNDRAISLSHSGGSNQSRDRSTFTHTSRTTYKGPGNERYTVQDRDFHSSIQRSSYNPPQKAITGSGGSSKYSNRGSGDVGCYKSGRNNYCDY